MLTQDQTKLDDISIEVQANLKRCRDARAGVFWALHTGQHYTGRFLDDEEIAAYSKALIELDAKISVYRDLSNLLNS